MAIPFLLLSSIARQLRWHESKRIRCIALAGVFLVALSNLAIVLPRLDRENTQWYPRSLAILEHTHVADLLIEAKWKEATLYLPIVLKIPRPAVCLVCLAVDKQGDVGMIEDVVDEKIKQALTQGGRVYLTAEAWQWAFLEPTIGLSPQFGTCQ